MIDIRKNRFFPDVLFFVGLALCGILLSIKATRSVCDADESFTVLAAFRWVLGDRVLVDEWHISQLGSMFLYLPLKVYYLLVGSCRGMILYSRFVFIGTGCVVAVVSYYTLRKYTFSAAAAAVFFFFHVPITIFLTLYYNSVQCFFTQLCALALISSYHQYSRLKIVLAGCFFGFAVVCAPMSAVLYAIYSLAAFVTALICRKKKENAAGFLPETVLNFKAWGLITVGILISAVGAAMFILRGNSVAELVKNIPMLLFDPEHVTADTSLVSLFMDTLRSFNKAIFDCFPVWLIVVGMLCFVALAVDKNRKAHRDFYVLFGSAINVLLLLFNYLKNTKRNNYLLYNCLPFVFFGVLCYLLAEKKKREFLFLMLLPGAAAAFCRGVESNMNFLASSAVMPVCTAASVLLIVELAREYVAEQKAPEQKGNKKKQSLKFRKTQKRKKIIPVVLLIVIVVQFGNNTFLNLGFNAETLYGDPDVPQKLTYRLCDGPLEGIYTTEKIGRLYEGTLDDLNTIKEQCHGPVMIPSECCWAYLYMDTLPIGSFSGYLSNWPEVDGPKMERYYEYHPERYPAYIYIPYFDRNLQYNSEDQRVISDSVKSSYPGDIVEGNCGSIIAVNNNRQA